MRNIEQRSITIKCHNNWVSWIGKGFFLCLNLMKRKIYWVCVINLVHEGKSDRQFALNLIDNAFVSTWKQVSNSFISRMKMKGNEKKSRCKEWFSFRDEFSCWKTSNICFAFSTWELRLTWNSSNALHFEWFAIIQLKIEKSSRFSDTWVFVEKSDCKMRTKMIWCNDIYASLLKCGNFHLNIQNKWHAIENAYDFATYYK